MPEVLLFGATGYTGRLTAQALHRRGANFAISGRDHGKLEALATTTGNPEIRVASVGDVRGLAAALEDVKVLITCVGPFEQLGSTAVEAALQAGVHYIDSTGEGPFIARLIENKMEQARKAGIAMAPAMGFDEVPADVAATLASRDLDPVDLTLTYAVPLTPSAGTLRSALGILSEPAAWIENGRRVTVKAGQRSRWAPMPPPLGPRSSVAFPLAEGHLAPLHLELDSLRVYATVGMAQRLGLKLGGPFLPLLKSGPIKSVTESLIGRLPEGPTDQQRRAGQWTILAEARSGDAWRNVALTGTDVYGLTAEFLSAAALRFAGDGPLETGVVAPVQAVGLEVWEKEFADHGVTIQTFEPH
ncbi:MAG TPA: saccharopine dehydrogenase NADP-binding domain-containing protein [Actinomycetota bacterium]|nr:saccharopine dehydrogenase NADP-binding domain-containing protein [Actinomycetota bacterium]